MRTFLALLVFMCLSAAPATRPATLPSVVGESVVLAGTQPANLLGIGIDLESVVVRSRSDARDVEAVVYERGRDYVLDPDAGTIARTATSRIPDFATNVLYGREDFDHTQFPGYGNVPFFAYVDYRASHVLEPELDDPQPQRLAKARAKLEAGGPFKVIAFGDSIAAGGDASREHLRFANLYAASLGRFPGATVTIENGSTGGDNTVNGLARIEEKVLSRKPDLVLLAFGMNDHNREGVGGVPVEQFQANLQKMVTLIRQRSGADVILLSTFPPNPKWAFGTHRMAQYAAATRRAADAMGAAYVDVYAMWTQMLKRKDPESLLGNNINHPNDFGHARYAEALSAAGP